MYIKYKNKMYSTIDSIFISYSSIKFILYLTIHIKYLFFFFFFCYVKRNVIFPIVQLFQLIFIFT